MTESITSLLGDFGDVLTAILTGIGSVAAFIITQPLLMIAIGFTVVGVIVKFTRSLVGQ